MSYPYLSSNTVLDLVNHMREQLPNEAVGLIDGRGKVFLLDNLSKTPHRSFEIDGPAIARLFNNGKAVSPSESVIWHTHPSGLIGPSTFDLRNKTMFKYHLVVTFTGDDFKLTWY